MKKYIDIICELYKKVKSKVENCKEVKNGYDLLVIEEEIVNIFRESSGEVMGEVLKERCSDKELEVKGIELVQKTRPWLKRGRYEEVEIKMLSGEVVKVRTLYMYPDREKMRGRKKKKKVRGKGGSGCYPVLNLLGISHRATPGLISEVSRQVVLQTSMERAREELCRKGIKLNIKVVRKLSLHFSQGAIEYREKLLKKYRDNDLSPGNILKEKIVVITVDGGRFQVRVGGKRGLKGKGGHRKFNPEWKEPKLLRIYVIDSKGKRLCRELDFIDGTLGDCNALMELVCMYLHVFGIKEAEKLIVIGDGAPWIWDRVSEIRDIFGLSEDKVIEILDFYHSVEHLSSALEECKKWNARKKKRWLNQQKQRLRQGHFSILMEALSELCRGRRSKEISKVIAYFQEHKERIKYLDFKKAGYPIGSGAIESAVRRVVNLRMKGPGIFWLPESAEAFLHVRAQLLSGRWDNLCEMLFSGSEHQFEDMYFQNEVTNIVSLEEWKKQRIKANESKEIKKAA
jgi:hypothetical protein